jgi:hypothetical protein
MKKIFIIALVMLAASECFAGSYRSLSYMDGFVPQPVLTQPSRDAYDLSGKSELVFKWSSHEQARGFRSYYDLRLYRGYDMLAHSLIYKSKVDPTSSSIALSASMFENGQVYTWSLRQVYDGGRKSDRSYQSFMVIKR